MPSARAAISASPDNRSSVDAGITSQVMRLIPYRVKESGAMTTGRVTGRARRTRWAPIHCQPAADGGRAGAGLSRYSEG